MSDWDVDVGGNGFVRAGERENLGRDVTLDVVGDRHAAVRLGE
jgi:hypothetical protein